MLDSGWWRKCFGAGKTRLKQGVFRMDHDIIGKATQVKLELLEKCFVGIWHLGVNENPKSQDLAAWTFRNLLFTTCLQGNPCARDINQKYTL